MTTHEVIVVGAGLAGLRCATDLVDRGVDVVVLESRARVGGRVWSHSFDDGQTCERGAEFIDASHTAVLELAAHLGLGVTTRRSDLDPDRALIDAAGRIAPIGAHRGLSEALARWEAGVSALGPRNLGGTLADVVVRLGLLPVARMVVGRDIRTEFMLPPEEIGLDFAADVSRMRPVGGREIHRIAGGNDRLARGLADALGSRVRLSTAVTAIDESRGEVHTARNGVMRADAVVSTVPLPVLSRLWRSAPPELTSVGYGIGGKISVQFARRVWRDHGRDGTVLSDRRWGHLWETTDDQDGDRGVLTNLLSSHDGASFVALPDAPTQLLREIDRVLPGSAGLAGAHVRTDWTNDPASLGCYLCCGPGQWAPLRAAVSAAHGRLWIAGEHADDHTGFMEGALRSGARVAELIAG